MVRPSNAVICRVLIGATALFVLPLWLLPYFPSQDGPSHAYNAWVLLNLDDSSHYAQFYEAALGPGPNWLGTIFLMVAGSVLPMMWAEKLLLTTIIVGFVWGFAWLARGRGDEFPPAVLLGPLFIAGYALYMGFYSFSLGLAVLPWTWAPAFRSTGVRSWIVVGVLAGVGLLAHVVVGALIVIGVVIIAVVGERVQWQLVATVSPAGLAVAWFALSLSSEGSRRWEASHLLETFISMRALAPYASAPETLARVVALGVLGLVFLTLKRQKWALWQRPWLAIFAVAFGLYMLLPNGSFGYWFLSERLSLFPWLALVPLMSAARPKVQLVVYAAFVAAFAYVNIEAQYPLSEELSEYVSVGDDLPDESHLLALDFGPPALRGMARAQPFLHAAGWIAIAHSSVDVGNYEAQTDHFQTRFKPYVRFPDHNQVAGVPHSIDLERYGPLIDHILVRHPTAAPSEFMADLRERYEAVSVRGPNTLFRRK